MNFLKNYISNTAIKNSEFANIIKGIKFTNIATKSTAKAVFSTLVLALAFLACPNSAKALNLQNKFTDFSTDNDFYENDSYIFAKNDYAINAKSLKNKGFASAKDIITAAPFVSTINSGYGDIISLRASTLLGGGGLQSFI